MKEYNTCSQNSAVQCIIAQNIIEQTTTMYKYYCLLQTDLKDPCY